MAIVPRLPVGLALFVVGLAAWPGHAADVVWTSASGVTVTANDLVKTATSGWSNAGAISTVQFDWGPAYVEATASETTTARIFGLSKGDTDDNYTDIDFAIHMGTSGSLTIYEGGSLKNTSTYATNDKLRVEAEPGVVRYLKNGAVFYTSATTPKYPLLVDAALNTNGATLNDVIAGTSVFARAASVTVSAGTLTKTGSSGWNAGAVSVARLETGDGYAELTATETNTSRALGLSRGDGGATLADIDFAVHLKADGTFEAVEGGSSQGNFGSYSASDVFRVEVLSGTVRYKQNGATFYTSGG